jgi:hypothetical protein
MTNERIPYTAKLRFTEDQSDQSASGLVFVTLSQARNIAVRPVGMLGAKTSRSHANVGTQAAL